MHSLQKSDITLKFYIQFYIELNDSSLLCNFCKVMNEMKIQWLYVNATETHRQK